MVLKALFHNAAVTCQIIFGLVGNSTICQNAFVHYKHFMLETLEAYAIMCTFMRLIKNIEFLLKCLEIFKNPLCLLTVQYVPSNDLFDCWVSPMTSSHAEWHHVLLLTVAKLHALGGWTLLLTFVLKDDIDRTLSTQWLQLWESCVRLNRYVGYICILIFTVLFTSVS